MLSNCSCVEETPGPPVFVCVRLSLCFFGWLFLVLYVLDILVCINLCPSHIPNHPQMPILHIHSFSISPHLLCVWLQAQNIFLFYKECMHLLVSFNIYVYNLHSIPPALTNTVYSTWVFASGRQQPKTITAFIYLLQQVIVKKKEELLWSPS